MVFSYLRASVSAVSPSARSLVVGLSVFLARLQAVAGA